MMKIKTVIGACVAFLLLLLVVILFLFSLYPNEMVTAVGLGPYSTSQIVAICATVAALVLLLGWLAEKLFTLAGRSGMYLHWRQRLHHNATDEVIGATPHTESDPFQRAITQLVPQLRQRYGRFWRYRVQFFALTGDEFQAKCVAPAVLQQGWQVHQRSVLLWAGSVPGRVDQRLFSLLRRLRPFRPLDAIIQIQSMATPAGHASANNLTTVGEAAVARWRFPLLLWFVDAPRWPSESEQASSVGVLLSTGTVKHALTALDALLPVLRQAGIKHLMTDPRHSWTLRLAHQLAGRFAHTLSELLSTASSAGTTYPTGLLFSPAFSHGDSSLATPDALTWRCLQQIGQCRHVRRGKWCLSSCMRGLPLLLLLLWLGGMLISLYANRATIKNAAPAIAQLSTTPNSLEQRLQRQRTLQQMIMQLRHQHQQSTPWYRGFGLNQDAKLLKLVWPHYVVSSRSLIQDGFAAHLQQALDTFNQLPLQRKLSADNETRAYQTLKAYLMLADPQKMDYPWLVQHLAQLWPPRAGGRYQQVLKQVIANWPDFTLADLVDDTDAAALFYTNEVIPGIFTRQAWEEQIADVIDATVKQQRAQVDWVLMDDARRDPALLSGDELKRRLTQRYFTDFAQAWSSMLNTIQWQETTSLPEVINQLNLLTDARQSPLLKLLQTVQWQAKAAEKTPNLTASLLTSIKKIAPGRKITKVIQPTHAVEQPLNAAFGPLLQLMGATEHAEKAQLNFQAWQARVIQVALKLQQVPEADDPQAMAQTLALAVFQGKATDFTETREYSRMLAASLGQSWRKFGQSLFVKPLDIAWQKLLTPAMMSINQRWHTGLVAQWDSAFAGRYPFVEGGSDASLPLLAQFIQPNSGRIATFLQSTLGGIFYLDGNRWVENAATHPGIRINPAFLQAINQLTKVADIAFTTGDAGVKFELMPQPTEDVARVWLTIDEQQLDYFNQMENWQRFSWPGPGMHPSARLRWRGLKSGMRLYADYPGSWGWVRLLSQAKITPLDSSRTLLEWRTRGLPPLRFVLRTELDAGPLVLLTLREFRLPKTIFTLAAP